MCSGQIGGFGHSVSSGMVLTLAPLVNAASTSLNLRRLWRHYSLGRSLLAIPSVFLGSLTYSKRGVCMRRPLFWLGALVALVACVTTRATVLNPSAKRSPICPDAVIIYTSVDKVGKQYVEVAMLDSRGDEKMTSVDQMYNSMRKKAAQLGANGVIVAPTQDPTTGAKVARALLGTSANRKGDATAIYVQEDSMRALQVCGVKT
jgi:hypothetical protein